jgi:hypothetical protein
VLILKPVVDGLAQWVVENPCVRAAIAAIKRARVKDFILMNDELDG